MAIISVVAFHAFPDWFPAGFIGVDVFFVISGFLISGILFAGLESGTLRLRDFYFRRAKRILPALVLVLAAGLAGGWFLLLPDEYMQLGKHVAGAGLFVANFLFWSESGYFDTAAETKPLLHLWSLAIEEQFYLLYPLLVRSAWGRPILPILIVGLAACSLVWSIDKAASDPSAAFFSPVSRVWELMIGCGLAYVSRKVIDQGKQSPSSVADPPVWNVLASALAALGAFLLLSAIYAIDPATPFPGAAALLPTLGTMLLIAAGPSGWINRSFLSSSILVSVGLISYPLYLWHWMLLAFARIVEGEALSASITSAVIVLSVVLSVMTYWLWERPIRFGGMPLAKTAGALSVSLLVLTTGGYVASGNDGFEDRTTVSAYNRYKKELLSHRPTDDGCMRYLGLSEPRFFYCRLTWAGSGETIAVIGDSHARAAYPGIGELLLEENINTVLIGNNSCPPLVGTAAVFKENEREKCRQLIPEMLELLVGRRDITKVVIVTRGPLYLTGKGFGGAEREYNQPPLISEAVFASALQATIDKLRAAGKRVYYVAENPEMGVAPTACLPRPFRPVARECVLDVGIVKTRQESYLEILARLRDVHVIETLDFFCPNGLCGFALDGQVLYADDDHLSVVGSRFQARNILKPYLVQRH